MTSRGVYRGHGQDPLPLEGFRGIGESFSPLYLLKNIKQSLTLEYHEVSYKLIFCLEMETETRSLLPPRPIRRSRISWIRSQRTTRSISGSTFALPCLGKHYITIYRLLSLCFLDDTPLMHILGKIRVRNLEEKRTIIEKILVSVLCFTEV